VTQGTDPYALAIDAAVFLLGLGWPRYDVVVTLGSGWQRAAKVWWPPERVLPMHEVPGFRDSIAEGHVAEIRSYEIGGRNVLVYAGRTHLYEGHGPAAVVHGVRVAAALGCRTAIFTNANGSFRPEWAPGTVAVIRDHLNLTGTSPIGGATFVDLTNAYSAHLRGLVQTVAPGHPEAVYAMVRGPHYETHAEGLAMARVGADVVGMSTVLETISAREAGMDVLALSVVTVTEGRQVIDPSEVVRVASDAAAACGDTIAAVIGRL
jgi:purine-nucleoside phosphorylase